MARLSVALVHYPVVDRHGELYTTAITNMDVHDIARSARTYGLSQYYLVTPITAQQQLAQTIADFWIDGAGLTRNRDRATAMDLVNVQGDFSGCIDRETGIIGNRPLLIATSAKICEKKTISYQEGQRLIGNHDSILILGTGYGLAPSIIDQADYLLEPIYGPDDYNHLSVRSAAAVIFDRLCAQNQTP
jgi:hypothetical protein